ncbi:MAG: hypothetical protein ACYC99_13525 [Candidatus Geothermincolia bacterium]
MAATIFEIIGIIAIIVAVLVAVLVLPFLARFLKKFNKSGVERAHQVRVQVTESLDDVDSAQDQLDAFGAVTEGVKAGMVHAIDGASKVVSFLESRTFQVGLPMILWFLLLVIALPRGLRRPKGYTERRRVIPPPSWEATSEAPGE